MSKWACKHNGKQIRRGAHVYHIFEAEAAHGKCWGTQYFKKIPLITQDLSRICIATRRESVSVYPRRLKPEAFSNTVDVIERLHDPTDPSTERTAPRVLHTFNTMTPLELLIHLRTRESSISTTVWR